MNKIWTFAGCCALLVAAVFGLSSMTPGVDPFSLRGTNLSFRLEDMPLPTRGEMKLRHALTRDRYDIGLFGSSRIIMVNRVDLALPQCRVFNFAIGGQSIRWVAGYAELLAARDKLPRISVISIDNFDLEFFHNADGIPLLSRWRYAVGDLWSGLVRKDITWLELTRMAWRHVSNEFALLKALFQPRYILHGLRQLLNFGGDDKLIGATTEVLVDPAFGYLPDGSRNIPDNPPKLANNFAPQPAKILPGYLRYDMERIAALDGGKTKVVIYESPLNDEAADYFRRNPNGHASALRRSFFETCRTLGLECHPAPTLTIEAGNGWWGFNHPPGPDLGRYLRSVIGERGETCSRDL